MIKIARYHAAALKFILNITFTNSKTLLALQQYFLLLDALIEAHNAIQMLQLINACLLMMMRENWRLSYSPWGFLPLLLIAADVWRIRGSWGLENGSSSRTSWRRSL